MAKIIGLDRLRRKLRLLPRIADTEVRAAMEKGADEMVALMKATAPVDQGDLRDSIGWTYGAAPKGAIKIDALKSGKIAITIYAGDAKAFYARWVEFGVAAQTQGQRITNASGRSRRSRRTTSGQAAQPFFYPSYRALRKRVNARIRRAVRSSIRKAAA
jgi:HK97 gp10 family phage protein